MTTRDEIEGGPAPLVSLTEARNFQSREDAEAYLERTGDPARAAILPHPDGPVIASVAEDGAILGYVA
jgi:hypothetical protein